MAKGRRPSLFFLSRFKLSMRKEHPDPSRKPKEDHTQTFKTFLLPLPSHSCMPRTSCMYGTPMEANCLTTRPNPCAAVPPVTACKSDLALEQVPDWTYLVYITDYDDVDFVMLPLISNSFVNHPSKSKYMNVGCGRWWMSAGGYSLDSPLTVSQVDTRFRIPILFNTMFETWTEGQNPKEHHLNSHQSSVSVTSLKWTVEKYDQSESK